MASYRSVSSVSPIRRDEWERLFAKADLETKIAIYRKANSRIGSFLDLADAFKDAIDKGDSELRQKINKALDFLKEDKEAYNEVIHQFQMEMLWELLGKYSPKELRKKEEDIISDYGEKLRERCQRLELFGIRGSSNLDVRLEGIFVRLLFFESIPLGGVPRLHPDEIPDDSRVQEYLDHYKSRNCLDHFICQVGTGIALVRTPVGRFA